jgi:hypothetical protein
VKPQSSLYHSPFKDVSLFAKNVVIAGCKMDKDNKSISYFSFIGIVVKVLAG